MSNLFFFWGQEDFLINSEIEKIKSENIDKNFEAMAYKHIYEPCFNDVINAISSLPMMFGNIMHVIDVNKFFLGKEKDSEDESNDTIDDFALKQLEKALESKSDKNIVVLRCIIPYDSKKKVDTRKKLYKIISKFATEKQFSIYREFDKNLISVIADLGKQSGLKLSSSVISAIIGQMGTKLGVINSELQKLSITLYPEKEPTINDIEKICTRNDDVFSILQALFKNDTGKAIWELRKSLEKVSVPEIMGALQYSLRNFTIIKAYFNRIGKSGLSQWLHVHEFVIGKNYELMSDFSGKKLLKLKNNLIKTEYTIKTGNCASPENALEMAIMEVCDV